MRKLLTLVLCFALLATMAIPAIAYTAGQYTATVAGRNGPMDVQVTFDGAAITDVEVLSHTETAGIADAAIARVPAAIVEGQTLAVDATSGATITSASILAAVEDCVAQAGGDVAALKNNVIERVVADDEVLDFDVVVVGGGAAGLAAAEQAATDGASVILMEKLSHLGGSTLLAGGILLATGTTYQAEAGVEDSVDALVQYWMDRAEGNADRELLTMVAERSAGVVEWLLERGVELTGPTTSGTSPVPRAVNTAGGGGFVNPLSKVIAEHGVVIRLDTDVKALITNDAGAVVGVEAIALDGHKVTVNAKGGVVLATGGYDVSEEMKQKYSPSIAGQYSYSGAGNVGDGINMALAVGADTVFKDGSIGMRGRLPQFSFSNPLDGQVWMPYLLVDAKGSRVVNESIDYPIYHSELVKNGSGRFFMIFDAVTANPDLLETAGKGEVYKADTLEALAEAAGMDASTFATTVARYNELKGLEDADFGKAAALMTGIGDGPYYALLVVPTSIGSMGGIKINEKSEVLRPDGSAITGLYAAGETANGDLFYQVYPASGTSIMTCFVFGREAGTNAAARAK